MKQMLKQRNRHRPEDGVYGDCHRAAVASVLGLALDDVPHFGDGGPSGEEMERREREFLRARGLVPLVCLYNGVLADVVRAVGAMNPGVYWLLGGKSRNGVAHTVVCLDGEIVNDPSIDESGIVGPMDDGYFWVTFFGTATATREG